jgi:hypothetical protein
MQTKTCPRCQATQPLTAFNRRAKSPDGYEAACRECSNLAKWAKYQGDPAERAATLARVKTTKNARFERDPAYKRAFNLWGSTKKRTRIPPWVAIADFVPICREALAAGAAFELDHIVPIKGKLVSGLHVPSNLRVVPRAVNQAKQNRFSPEDRTSKLESAA